MNGQLTETRLISASRRYSSKVSNHTWDLVQIDANAVVLGVSVKEHTELQQRIRTVFDTWHHAARRECCLFNISVEVLGVLVQHHAAEVMHLEASVNQLDLIEGFTCAYRELTSGPDFRNIERVKAKDFNVCVCWVHDLNLCVPNNLLSILDSLPEFLFRIIGVDARHLDRLGSGVLLLSVLGDEMIFDVNELALLVDPIVQ